MNSCKNLILLLGMLWCPSTLLAQENDAPSISRADSTAFRKMNKTTQTLGVIVPAAMVTYGIVSLHSNNCQQLDYKVRSRIIDSGSQWNNTWGDYLQFAPAVAAVGLKGLGVKSTHKLPDMLMVYALSNLLETGVIFSSKRFCGRQRPNGSNNHSFPSGHTATAFVAAEFLHQEYKGQSIWISIGGYSMATLVGVSRIYNDKHWVSDVIAGAGVGILSTKLVYWVYPHFRRKEKKDSKTYSLFYPSYSNRALSMNFSCAF